MVGAYDVNVLVGKLPQKVATYFDSVMGKLLGAVYVPVAYLGSQVVNGINHALLCEQTVITGIDTRNAVMVVMNEKEEGLSLVSITPVLESGGPLGGVVVDVKTEIPEEASTAFAAAFEQFVGSTVEPFALLGTQAVHGTNYIFAAKVFGAMSDGKTKIFKITLNSLTGFVDSSTILG